MNINIDVPDDYIVYKFGKTDNIERRTREHISSFAKVGNINLKLNVYSYIDPPFITKAESDITLFFKTNGIHINYNNSREIYAISPTHIKAIKEEYNTILSKYGKTLTHASSKHKDLTIEYEHSKQICELKTTILEQKIIMLEHKIKHLKTK